ncbi:NADP-dependent flavoprotein reductase, partial [Pseudoloma neurophilia]
MIIKKLKELSINFEIFYQYIKLGKRSFLEIFYDLGLKLPYDFLKDLIPENQPRFFTLTRKDGLFFITLTIVDYEIERRRKRGVCSTYLSEIELFKIIDCQIIRSHLDYNKNKLLFICTGAGITLPRSFWEYFRSNDHKLTKEGLGMKETSEIENHSLTKEGSGMEKTLKSTKGLVIEETLKSTKGLVMEKTLKSTEEPENQKSTEGPGNHSSTEGPGNHSSTKGLVMEETLKSTKDAGMVKTLKPTKGLVMEETLKSTKEGPVMEKTLKSTEGPKNQVTDSKNLEVKEIVIFFGHRLSCDRVYADEMENHPNVTVYYATSRENERKYVQDVFFATEFDIELLKQYEIFVSGRTRLNKEIRKM